MSPVLWTEELLGKGDAHSVIANRASISELDFTESVQNGRNNESEGCTPKVILEGMCKVFAQNLVENSERLDF
jgi:hypothetical protein